MAHAAELIFLLATRAKFPCPKWADRSSAKAVTKLDVTITVATDHRCARHVVVLPRFCMAGQNVSSPAVGGGKWHMITPLLWITLHPSKMLIEADVFILFQTDLPRAVWWFLPFKSDEFVAWMCHWSLRTNTFVACAGPVWCSRSPTRHYCNCCSRCEQRNVKTSETCRQWEQWKCHTLRKLSSSVLLWRLCSAWNIILLGFQKVVCRKPKWCGWVGHKRRFNHSRSACSPVSFQIKLSVLKIQNFCNNFGVDLQDNFLSNFFEFEPLVNMCTAKKLFLVIQVAILICS